MLNEMDLSRMDLNLLVLFDTVLREKHVGRAAARLHLSPSAVSHGIRRLRQTFNDPVFLKHPKGVVPTARALAMAEPVAQVLAQVRHVIAAADRFDPRRSRRRFVIGAPDAISVVALPAVIAKISQQAPGIGISVRHLQPVELTAALDAREIDVALYPLEEIPARFDATLLYEEDFVIAARADHQLGRRPSLDRYCAARHLLVSGKGEAYGVVDDVLKQHGRSREVALTVPGFMFALAIIGSTDLIGTLPRSLLRVHAARFGVVALEPPLPFVRSGIRVVAPKAASVDLGIAGLKNLLGESLSRHARGRRKPS